MSRAKPRSLRDLRRGEKVDVFSLVDEVVARKTRDGRPYYLLRVSDSTRSGSVWVFSDSHAFEACQLVAPGDMVKIRVDVEKTDDGLDMKGLELRPVGDDDPVDSDSILGPLPDAARAVARGTVAFDIETTARIGLDDLPDRERDKFQRAAIRDARRETGLEVPDAATIEAALAKAFALNSLTTRVVSVGFHALESGAELALVTDPDHDLELPAVALDEVELLRAFWGIARRVRTIVGFNSRRFDVPVLLTRSAQLGVRAALDLLPARHERDARHVDLFDVMRGRGAAGDRRLSLELAAFGFDIPVKERGHGSEIASLVQAARYQEIAEYNLEDARATARLYQRLVGTWL